MTPDLSALRDLKARVEGAEGPSRELDAMIWQVLVKGATSLSSGFGYSVHLADGVGHPMGPHLTSSTDEALALVERTLPPIKAMVAGSPPSSGWKINAYRGMTPTGQRYAHWDVNIREHASNGFDASAPTLPFALLSALLSALIAKAERSAALDTMVEIGQVKGLP